MSQDDAMLLARPLDIRSGRAFLPLFQVELNFFALGESLEAVTLNRAEVHEHITTVFCFDETESLGFVEPLHFTLHAFLNFLQ